MEWTESALARVAFTLAGAVAVAMLPLGVALMPGAVAAPTWSFVDRAREVGVSGVSETWWADAVDYDRDGLTDLWIGYHDWGGALFRNHGEDPLHQLAGAAWPRLTTRVVDRHGCDWGDVNGDDRLDQYCTVGRTGANRVKVGGYDNELWIANEDGTFTDVGTAWGLGDPYGRGRDAVLFDANGDGWSDLYVTNETARQTDADGGAWSENKLFLNTGGTGFVRAPEFGVDTTFGNGQCAQAVDLDADGWTDLMVCGWDRLHLFHNDAGTGFTDVSASHGLSTSYREADLADIDGDGDLDVIGIQKTRAIQQLNVGNGVFSSLTTLTTLTAGFRIEPGDADGDGRTDVYALQSDNNTNPNDVLLLNRGGAWQPVAVPPASGSGSDVEAVRLRPGAPDQFLVLNGREVTGPIQLLSLVEGTVSSTSPAPTSATSTSTSTSTPTATLGTGWTAEESFESGTLGETITQLNSWFQDTWGNGGAGGSFMFDATWSAQGTQSAFVTADSATTVVRTHRLPGSTGSLVVGVWARWRTPLPSRTFAFLRLAAAGNNRAAIVLSPGADGPHLALRNGTTLVATAPFPVNDSESYRLEWQVDASRDVQELRIFAGPDAAGTTPSAVLSGRYDQGTFNALNVGAIFPPGVNGMGMWLDALSHAPVGSG